MEELTFGQRLVLYRIKASLLQKELAEKVGISPTALNYYEKDKREPNVMTIKALSEALNITGDELLGINIPELANEKSPLTYKGRELSERDLLMLSLFQQIPEDKQSAFLDAFEILLRTSGVIE